MATNTQVLLASRPTGWVQESNFSIVATPIPKPGPGQILVRNTGCHSIHTCAAA
jgi:NADPH-dependent curcumin reductase